MNDLRGWAVLILCAGLVSCASYNAMWNAEQRAKDARRLEQQGQLSEARAQWAQAAVKAGKVRGDKALVLRIEALSRSGACRELPAPLSQARSSAMDGALRERADLAEAECALAAGDAARAETVLAEPLKSRNPDRRARAEYTAGRVAALRQDYDAATAHFARASEPDAAGRAFVAEQRARIARATQRSDLAFVAQELSRVLRTTSGADEAGRLVELLTAVQAVPEGPGARYHIAELARDSLQAPLFAGRLFLEAAASDTASLFAPKALIAALPLLSEQRDSIVALLDTRYAMSPYTRAFHGEASVAYAVAEDSLARVLGVQGMMQRSAPAGVRRDGSITGPRGPKLP